MATPTPSGAQATKHSLTSHATATPPSVSHLPNFNSPAPRSVPSPAAQRGQQAGKSPFNGASLAPSVGSTAAAQNHPTGSSGRGGGGMAALLGSSPAGLDIGTPVGLGVGLGNLGGVEMGIGMSMTGSQMGLGMGMAMGMSGSMGAGRAVDDEERRKRLEKVVETLGSKPGRVSDEGIERLAQRCGMAVQCDPPIGKGDGDGVRQLAIAGETLLIEIQSQNNAVQAVSVQWPEQNEEEYAKSAAALLKTNLAPQSPVSFINCTLEKFAHNLERLSRLDKLEGPNFNCFEAISGVYVSLKRLYEHEKKVALALIGEHVRNRDERASRETMCKKSGKPRLNERGQIGMAVDYWMDDRFTFDASSQDASAMDIEGTPSGSQTASSTYSLIIDCESHPSALYPPIRTSNAWLSDAVEKQVDEHGIFTEIDWQDPPPTFLHNPHEPEQSADQMMNDLGMSSSKLPSIRFVARLDPPLAMPSQIVYYILNTVGSQPDTTLLRPVSFSYDGLLLTPSQIDEVAEQQAIQGANERQRQFNRQVLVPSGENDLQREHNQNLYTKPEYGATLREFPFSHPNQFVAVLPILRQYAFLNSLLKRTLESPASPLSPPSDRPPANGDSKPEAEHSLAPLSVDITLQVLPLQDINLQNNPSPSGNPRLAITFCNAVPLAPQSSSGTNGTAGPDPADEDDGVLDGFVSDGDGQADDRGGAVSVSLEIAPNGTVVVADQNVVPSSPAFSPGGDEEKADEGGEKRADAKEKDGGDGNDADEDMMDGFTTSITKHHERESRIMEQVRRLGRAVEVAGDLGVWIEWVNGRVVGQAPPHSAD